MMIGNKWDEILKEEFEKDYFKELMKFVDNEYKTKTIYPYFPNVFNALKYTDYDNVKVVIIGQDPYHGMGEAHGLSFSVLEGVNKPPSLRNIFKELRDDLGIEEPNHGNLESWTREGVMLLNAVLTVEKDKPASHQGKGWETFTDEVIKKVNEKTEPVVFLLWGSFAKSKKELITNPIHCVIESAHPSPFSAYKGFFGTKPFSKTNEFLKNNNIKEINWEIKN
ncbi:MAG: uracil-DNA glycosylase [Firmicutes bacterium]|nr:uracil-DNA glycosylase [Bacillota bacterium]